MLNECWKNSHMRCPNNCMMSCLKKTSWTCNRSDARSGTSPKAPYRMNHEELKKLKVQLENSLQRVTSNLTSHHMGHPSSLLTKWMGHWGCVWIIEPSTRWQWKIKTHYLELMICLIDFWELKCLVGLTYVWDITKFKL